MALKLHKVRYEKKGHIAYVTIDNAAHENCLEEIVDQDLWKVWHDFRDARSCRPRRCDAGLGTRP
jgi:hypothetical protein